MKNVLNSVILSGLSYLKDGLALEMPSKSKSVHRMSEAHDVRKWPQYNEMMTRMMMVMMIIMVMWIKRNKQKYRKK